MWTFWYIREASCALYVANIPMCWPLMRRLFNLRSFHNSDGIDNPSQHLDLPVSSSTKKSWGHNPLKSWHSRVSSGETSRWDRDGLSRTESEENIITPPSKAKMPLEIWERKQFDVENSHKSRIDEDHSRFAQKDVMFVGGVQTTTVVSTWTAPKRSSDSIDRYNSIRR
jgi:hypothetical protein